MTREESLEVATLAGGCFWCLEAAFLEIDGVEGVVSGYTGGTTINPSYEQVCTGKTGHAEAVQITFRPSKLSYRQLLEIFFSVHDPGTLNRQGMDLGTQYRSAIFYHNQQQKEIAEELIGELDRARIWGKPIVTQIVPLGIFYPAEEYHQRYFSQHMDQAYCRTVILPKISKLRQRWAKQLKK